MSKEFPGKQKQKEWLHFRIRKLLKCLGREIGVFGIRTAYGRQKGQEETSSSLPNDLLYMDGRTGFGRDNKGTKKAAGYSIFMCRDPQDVSDHGSSKICLLQLSINFVFLLFLLGPVPPSNYSSPRIMLCVVFFCPS